ncbi:MAG: hypothetical protein JOZ81_02240 [Chloroflexi bacterium]|nr:hypothetical protein [Chloroflexota bacterium]
MTQTPRSNPPSTGDQVQAKAGQVADQAQGAAGQVAAQAKQQATSQLESQKDRVVDTLVTVAQALRQTGQQLNQQEQGAVGGYVEQAAERVERTTNYLRAHDVPDLIAETQDFARRQPGLFVTGALALGFLGARFLMSSGRRASQRSTTSSYGGWSTGARSGPLDIPPYGAYQPGVESGDVTTSADVSRGIGRVGPSGGLAG